MLFLLITRGALSCMLLLHVISVQCILTAAFVVVPVRLPVDTASSSSLHHSNSQHDTFVVSLDGALANTVEWRIRHGIQAAARTWPQQLHCIVSSSSNDAVDAVLDNNEWLSNKMKALSHVMMERPGLSLTCDFALLARMLVEEQELDRGRSVGLNGKYASKFHPSTHLSSSTSTTSYASTESQRRTNDGSTGSRPLTVGEISANWSEGALLSDTVMVKYNVEGKNPLPILQSAVEDLLLEDEKKNVLPFVWNDGVCAALSQSLGRVIVTVSHESEIPMLQRLLHQTPLGASFLLLDSDESKSHQRLSTTTYSKTIVHQSVMDAPKDSTVHVIHSSWKTLLQAKPCFGDNIPRHGKRAAIAAIGDGSVQLSLNLPQWAENTHWCQHNDAEMDPWTNLISENDFTELVSDSIWS